ncbi:hypothetical protein [Archangium lansingense]|uniref:Uncharacterized protein n=1 Tax=Archangium lansingense TaxID=2995310 RepID=A0ABT4ABB1_9BACT|nr:hypothetical protein [Archangium lansinium]MCY1078961.1 hypothetical protein [Archangium lansinium]
MTLTIRDAQLASLQHAVDERYCRELVPLLRTRCGGLLTKHSDEDIVARAREALGRVARYGLEDARDILAFIVLTFAVGPGFDTHPSFAAILADPRIPGRRKLPALFERLDASLWDAAAARG